MNAMLLAENASRVKLELGRLQSYTQWWQMPLLVLVCAAIALVVLLLYRRDSVELRRGTAGLLVLLRLAAFAGLLAMYLDVQKRAEKRVVNNSRVLLLVDGSLSMGLTDKDSAAAPTPASSSSASSSSISPGRPEWLGQALPPLTATRIDQVVRELTAGELLTGLREKNDLVVMRFDRDTQRVAALDKLPADSTVRQPDSPGSAANRDAIERAGYWGAGLGALAAAALAGLFLLAGPGGWSKRRRQVAAVAGIAVAALGATGGFFLAPIVYENWVQGIEDDELTDDEPSAPAKSRQELLAAQGEFDWQSALRPRGVETRLGQSVRDVILGQRGAPISAIVVVSDGGQNAGPDPGDAIAAAREARIPVYAIGIGSDVRPVNLRVLDLAVPIRGYPDDGFSVTGILQGDGLAGKKVNLELSSRRSGKTGAADPSAKVEATREVELDKHGKALVKFDLPGIAERGRRTYRLALKPLGEETDATDNQQEAEIEIVDRKTQVLLFAGGPTREYQFLRNQLRRDKEMVVHVCLQTAAEGISQDAEKILDEFPNSLQELTDYDCIIAFDPDWTELSAVQLDAVERWVAEESGGMISIAGPVYTNEWVRDPKMAKVRNLHPVEFSPRALSLQDGKYGATTPAPIEFTREGLEAEFLWLGDTAAASQEKWSEFKGIFGYFQVKGPKPGATVYGRFADPDAVGVEQTTYLAGHFFGSGRVFYQGSGEFWRLRAIDDAYFDRLYTKLVRHASQGRLSRGSKHGNLQVERDRYLLGDTIAVRSQLFDARHEPLTAAPSQLHVIQPDGAVLSINLIADPSRKGNFSGQFPALKTGSYRIELPTFDAAEEPLSRVVQVRIPDLELENPQRRDDVLSDLAQRTRGKYYIGLPAATEPSDALAAQIKDRTEVTYQPLSHDRRWERNWMTAILVFICAALSLEWLIRRLSRLA